MTTPDCPFCHPSSEAVFHRDEYVFALWDAYPVAPGHALIVTHRHIPDWFSATPPEHAALAAAIATVRAEIEAQHSPSGYNIGMNIGAAGGQTVPHLHLHVIPRYIGDVLDPRGGIRHVIPGKGNYLLASPVTASASLAAPHARALVVGGDTDPLLPHLLAHLAEAKAVDIAVAFVLQSGVRLLFEYLQDVLNRGGRVRFLTGDYRDVSEPVALRMLCDLIGDVDLRVFDASRQSFHPKSFIIYGRSGEDTAFVGSSNLSRTALATGIEWNYRVVTGSDQVGFAAVAQGFEALVTHPNVQPLTPEWIDSYEIRRQPNPAPDDAMAAEPLEPLPVPHFIQEEALRALDLARADGAGAGLVVLATGLGKTWLSAFDSVRSEATRVLFVAHRDEILGQALATFRRIRPDATLGYFTGTEKNATADVLFASIQTLGKQVHLDRFAPDAFDYIVVDEFHHAAAPTYRKLIEHFTPRFLLGLTATPERTDGGDLLALCGENLIYRCDLIEGIRRGLLCPFDYYGVPDIVDFKNIPWRSGRFDEKELTNAVATQARAANALEQYRERAGERTIGFCVSQRHADYMADYFDRNGLRAVSVHSGESSAPRAQSLDRLEKGDLDVLFAVDMFNEGVDLPQLDTVMMLRPTESSILWLQQFGRGLRKHKDKRLKVIDYIGNHRSFLVKPRTLLGLEEGDAAIARALHLIEVGQFELPPGCSVTYDLEATDILKALLRTSPPGQRLQTFYEDFRDRNGYRPSATETFHSGYDPKSARPSYASWLSFVRAMDGLSAEQVAVYQQLSDFLDSLEVTPMTKSYKMVVLLAMLAEGAVPGGITLATLRDRVRTIARRYGAVRTELAEVLDDDVALGKLLEDNPIAAWTGARGTGGTQFFSYQGNTFATTFSVPDALRASLQELVREIVEWRVAVYARRASGLAGAERIVCKVSHSGGKPILFLPPRDRTAGIPSGWVDVSVDGEQYQANFVKIAVNVLQRPDEDENQLPTVLRRWFGADAGLPGTTHAVEFVREGEGYVLRPAGDTAPPALALWTSYIRAAIPPLFGFEFTGMQGQLGVVERDGLTLLFVTLDKASQPEAHRYDDGFISPSEFRWQSQNRTSRESGAGERIAEHVARGISVHLFVRAQSKLRGKTQPFTYCGPLTFERWEGDKPITVWWKLAEPVPKRLWQELRVPGGEG